MDDSTKSEAKLVKICEEAQNLTQMINSMQHSQNYKTQAKGTSIDLMKGAFDLQESLITLKKMSSKKEMQDLDIAKGSSRFEKLAMNGSLFSYIEELKKVIKESSSSGRPEISCNVNANNLSTRSLGSLMKKERSPCLIAKLMGLEDFPPAIEEAIVQNQNLELKKVKDVVKSYKVMDGYEANEQEISSYSSSDFPTKVLAQNLQSDKVFILNKNQQLGPDRQEMFPKKLERMEVFDNVRNKIISNQKPVKLVPNKKETGKKIVSSATGKNNASSKLNTKELKVKAAPNCRVPTKCNRSITRKFTTVNDNHIEIKRTDELRRKNHAVGFKPQNIFGPVKVKNTVKKEPVKNSIDVKSMARATNCKDVNVCTTTKQIKHHSYIRGRNTEVMVKCNKGIKSSTSHIKSFKTPNNITTPRREAKVIVDVQTLLLNSENFIMNARELFGINCHQNKNQLSLRARETKLLIDCANEFMLRKKHQTDVSKSFLVVTSLDQMVDEISHGIESLNGYGKDKAGLSSMENVYARMEKDIRCRQRMIDAIWDFGWANMSCVEEVDAVVDDVEELILYWLVEESVVELFY